MNEKIIQKNIVITGVSSGIGKSATEAFIKNGFRVFGSVRKDEIGKKMKNQLGNNFYPIICDIQNESEIHNFSEQVTNIVGNEGICGLINNAGIGIPGPLMEQSNEELKSHFEVNVFGLIQVSKAFLPLLKLHASRSRISKIINISSVSGKYSAPFMGAYTASKHAIEAISDSMRMELDQYGIKVIVIEPGNVITPIWQKANIPEAYTNTDYKDSFRKFITIAIKGGEKGLLPEKVANILIKIIQRKTNKLRYSPIVNRFINWTLPKILPDRIMDKIFINKLGIRIKS